MATTTHATRLEAARRLFSRILVGIDSSQQALGRQRLPPPPDPRQDNQHRAASTA